MIFKGSGIVWLWPKEIILEPLVLKSFGSIIYHHLIPNHNQHVQICYQHRTHCLSCFPLTALGDRHPLSVLDSCGTHKWRNLNAEPIQHCAIKELSWHQLEWVSSKTCWYILMVFIFLKIQSFSNHPTNTKNKRWNEMKNERWNEKWKMNHLRDAQSISSSCAMLWKIPQAMAHSQMSILLTTICCESWNVARREQNSMPKAKWAHAPNFAFLRMGLNAFPIQSESSASSWAAASAAGALLNCTIFPINPLIIEEWLSFFISRSTSTTKVHCFFSKLDVLEGSKIQLPWNSVNSWHLVSELRTNKAPVNPSIINFGFAMGCSKIPVSWNLIHQFKSDSFRKQI